jgi:phospho-N-acetylmuramoyl-pentapeptide-transferase
MNHYLKLLFLFFTVNIVISPLLISLLKRLGFYKKREKPQNKKIHRNEKYYKHLAKNMETPSSFGVLLIINLIFWIIFFGGTKEINFLIFIVVALGLLGFADDIYEFFFYKKTGHWGFKARYKMLFQLFLFCILFFAITNSIYYSVLLSVCSTFILNSFNITDGLDGLAGGLAIPSFIFFGYLEYVSFGFGSMFFLILVILSFLFVFLFFNIKPAKAFLGDSGSYLLGGILAYLTFRYNLIFTIPVIVIFLLEGTSSLLQILSIKLLDKRVFKIAPLHLHLLNVGWSQWKVISVFWIAHLVLVFLVYIFSQYVG